MTIPGGSGNLDALCMGPRSRSRAGVSVARPRFHLTSAHLRRYARRDGPSGSARVTPQPKEIALIRPALTVASLILFASIQLAPGRTPLTAAAVVPAAQDSTQVKNERFGFAFRAPKGWTSVAMKTDEEWLVSKHVSNKQYFGTDKTTGYTYTHKPEMLCIAFVHANQDRKKIVDEETEDGVTTRSITISNPYKDYEDFLDRTYAGGGWYVDSKEKGKHGKIEVTRYEVKVEKLARSGPKRIITWIFHAPDIDFVVQTEVLEKEQKKLRSTIERSLKTFKFIERSGEKISTNASTIDSFRITRRELTQGTPKERRSKRVESQKIKHERAIAALPTDWDHLYCGKVLVLDHDQKKWSKRLGDHADAVLKWMNKEFQYFGEGEYVRAPIVRVCSDIEEEGAFTRGVTTGTTGSWVYTAPGSEIVTHKSDEGWIGSEVDWVNGMLLRQWLLDRNEDVANAMPEWIEVGIVNYVRGARLDGRKLEFRVNEYAREGARLAVAQGRATTPREIMRLTREEFTSSSSGGASYFSKSAESAQLVRFLMSKEGKRNKQAKGLLENYVTALTQVVEEINKKDNESFKADEAPKTEEEEDARGKARAERWRQREQDMVREVFERTFADWTDKDWDKFTKAYFDFIS